MEMLLTIVQAAISAALLAPSLMLLTEYLHQFIFLHLIFHAMF
jgi:hypothetical protein